METVMIRQAGIGDFEDIYNFICGLENEVFDKLAMSACYAACMDTPHYHYLVATVGSKAVGYLSCHGQILMHHCGMVYEIQEMYVLPEFRSMGIGKKLVDALATTIAETGYVLLEAASNQVRTDAHRFYLKYGFEQTSYKFRLYNGK